MTEDVSAAGGSEATVRTGNARVDAVIEQVADLEDRPVDEHAVGFESAHDELRRALDEPAAEPDPASDPA